jgi:hypothetical protein
MNRLIDFMAMIRYQSGPTYRGYLRWVSGQIEGEYRGAEAGEGSVRGE